MILFFILIEATLKRYDKVVKTLCVKSKGFNHTFFQNPCYVIVFKIEDCALYISPIKLRSFKILLLLL